MADRVLLDQLLERSASLHPSRIAVEEADGGKISYAELADLAARCCGELQSQGVGRGDRVGIYLRKSIDGVAAIFGILKTGAAYVPVDPAAPPARNAYILSDCGVKAALVEERFEARLKAELEALSAAPALIAIDDAGSGGPLDARLANGAPIQRTDQSRTHDDLAYILYTSGSTGKPKGVMLSHLNATSFVDWCSSVFQPAGDERFSSHAPFHFDLSILDIYVPIKHGATLVLIGEELGKDPVRLAEVFAARGITSWYSTPSILTLLVQYGKLERFGRPPLRRILFAGEVFPMKHLRALKALVPGPALFNLYGPTETNVCTWLELPAAIPPDRTDPFPIGRVCSHLRARVVDESGEIVARGREGELCIAGDGVMHGYWNKPEQYARVFLLQDGDRWYRTGDIVTEEEDGVYVYLGRKDRMVKKRGYRVELGEIEAALYRHPAVKEAALVAVVDGDAELKLRACLSFVDGLQPSRIELKRFCVETLPAYMVPDTFVFYPVLPKTSTSKIDYQRLKEL